VPYSRKNAPFAVAVVADIAGAVVAGAVVAGAVVADIAGAVVAGAVFAGAVAVVSGVVVLAAFSGIFFHLAAFSN